MNYNEALEFIHSVSNFFCKPGLERITALCNALGNPQNSLKFVHIAGTNGKGSLCAFLSEILKSAGYTVGTYTSPYILRFNERISVNGNPIPDLELAEICLKVKKICDKLTDDKPTEFEIITAVAFEYFKRKKCDIVVLECGLGGRFDATNIIDTPLISVITGIALDHQNFLGNTIEQIAYEKAGIIKRTIPCLWCGNNTTAENVIKKEADLKHCDFYKVKHNNLKIIKSDLSGTEFDFENHKNLKINLLGLYQPENAANAVITAKLLNNSGFYISEHNIIEGLSNTYWPARFEILSEKPLIIFDGSHNPQGICATVSSIKHYFKDKKINIISGVMKDKDYLYIADKIKEIANRVYCVTVNNPRALSAEEYCEVFKNIGVLSNPYESISKALNAAIFEALTDNTPILCLGSLYMYSDIYNALRDSN